jgi:hypothetical protein
MTNRTIPILTADIDHRDHAEIELAIRGLNDLAWRMEGGPPPSITTSHSRRAELIGSADGF